jgi:hypothetical protein
MTYIPGHFLFCVIYAEDVYCNVYQTDQNGSVKAPKTGKIFVEDTCMLGKNGWIPGLVEFPAVMTVSKC